MEVQKKTVDIFSRLRKGESLPPSDPEYNLIAEACRQTKARLLEMNSVADVGSIRRLLGQITGEQIHEGTTVFTPFSINYGKNTRIGKNVFINFDCIFLDLGGIIIEDDVLLGPRVSLLTEGHPISAKDRHALQVAPIHIKKNAWIGANATILSGVTIGANAIVAAGAVVTKDVPDNTLVGGLPAKMLKRL